jgi:hypothetical protein
MLDALDQEVVPRESPVAELVHNRAERMLSDTIAG